MVFVTMGVRYLVESPELNDKLLKATSDDSLVYHVIIFGKLQYCQYRYRLYPVPVLLKCGIPVVKASAARLFYNN